MLVIYNHHTGKHSSFSNKGKEFICDNNAIYRVASLLLVQLFTLQMFYNIDLFTTSPAVVCLLGINIPRLIGRTGIPGIAGWFRVLSLLGICG